MSDLTARDVIAHQVSMGWHRNNDPNETADDVVAALAAAGWRLKRDDQWEWGVRYAGCTDIAESTTEAGAREVADA